MKMRFLFILSLLFTYPLHSNAAPDGAALYETNCAACHQINGGGIGLPLSPGNLTAVSDKYIKLTIRYGRAGRIMPAFRELSNAQVDAITAYIRSWSGQPGPQYPDTPVRGDRIRGKALYQLHCSSCHAEDGSGEGLGTGVTHSRGREFAIMPPAISNEGFLRSASDQMIKQAIMDGRPGTDMQSYIELGLQEEDINDLVSYVRSFEDWYANLGGIEATGNPQPALIFDSPYDFETTIENVKSAIVGRNFRYFPDRYLETGLVDETEVNDTQMTIRFCNFNQLYELLRIEPRLGVGLPCRITVIEHDDGSVQLVAMNMRAIADLFNNDQLVEMGKMFNEIQLEIIEEATL